MNSKQIVELVARRAAETCEQMADDNKNVACPAHIERAFVFVPGLIDLANEVIRLDEEDCGLAANDGLDVMNLFQLARDAIAALPKDD